MVGEVINVVNRTTHPLEVRMNGRTRVLTPGVNAITSEWVKFAKLQNPRKGTFAPATIDGDYLVGVEGHDDCSMLSPEQENAHLVENFDRSSQAVDTLPTGVRAPTRMSDPISANGGFDRRN